MPRVAHIIKRNKACQSPTRHLFFDIESHVTDQGNGTQDHTLWLGWYCFWRVRSDRDTDTENWELFTQMGEFWDAVVKHTHKREPLYLIAHNISYDVGVLHGFDELESRGYKVSSFYTSGMTSIIELVGDGGKIIILDNGNYFGGSLDRWGSAIGFPKMDVNPLSATQDELIPYCKRDVEILVQLWRNLYQFVKGNDLGNVGKTLPSQAFNAYRHRFMFHPIYIHDNERVSQIEREAYHGGRCSCFQVGDIQGDYFYKLDVNSMYPYVMHEYQYPVKMIHKLGGMGLPELMDKINRYAIVARCTLNTDEPVYPVDHHGHIVYPVGVFHTTLTTPELAYAIEHDHLVTITTCMIYETAPIFAEYVAYFYELKQRYAQEPNSPYYTFAKLYLNSLYGKFGQLATHWERLDGENAITRGSDVIVRVSQKREINVYRFGSTVWTKEVQGESFNSFPAIAGHVTAYARMYLWRLITLCGRDHVFYTDTDSLITDETGYQRLSPYLDASTLGMLKIEDDGDTLTIQAPKVYRLGDHAKRKGIPKHAVQVEPHTWRFDRFPSMLTQAKWDKGTDYHTTTTQRHLSYTLYDGIAEPDGKVSPLPASRLTEKQHVQNVNQEALAQIIAQIQALRESYPLDPKTVFTIWDFRRMTLKRIRRLQWFTGDGKWTYPDDYATEYGFDDARSLESAVRKTLDLFDRIRELEHRKYRLIHPSELTINTEPIPF